MTRYAAFLRAINVGGRTVKMEALRQIFADLLFANVQTYIQSGNVVFDVDDADAAALAQLIEAHLQEALGYAVPTFLRTTDELRALADAWPFPHTAEGKDVTLYVAFVRAKPPAARQAELLAQANEVDLFHVAGNHVFWLRRRYLGESAFSGARIEKALATAATVRNISTIRKMARRFA
ncbi:MAG: DUF1697 domain-containing protein [Anaerolineales bacterium]|nr:DUF1697 domain-containing protein [Anaerolineales bacterium]MCB8954392.1 DUF1697 domain-containing protein [Ardenticatenales bacterium]